MADESLFALLADLIGDVAPPAVAPSPPRPAANPANSANREHWRGLQADPRGCEGLRISANPPAAVGPEAPEIAGFADIRKAVNRPESEHWRGFSQDSQDSQGSATDAIDDPAPWAPDIDDPDLIELFHERAAILEFDAGLSRANAEREAAELLARVRGAS